MACLQETKILPYTAKQMFDMVIDVEKYSEFLPWCKNAKIIQHHAKDNFEAELLINFKSFYEKYTSDVVFRKISQHEYFVEVIAIKGPFKSLVNKWRFHEIDNSHCKVDFFLDFEFNSKILSKMFGAIFGSATKKMMLAFELRAKELYRKS
jgi:coenzyme Q-binding protein COQ10